MQRGSPSTERIGGGGVQGLRKEVVKRGREGEAKFGVMETGLVYYTAECTERTVACSATFKKQRIFHLARTCRAAPSSSHALRRWQLAVGAPMARKQASTVVDLRLRSATSNKVSPATTCVRGWVAQKEEERETMSNHVSKKSEKAVKKTWEPLITQNQ